MVTVRGMEESDIRETGRLEREIFPDPWSEKGIRDTFRQPHTFLCVAGERGEIEGYCILSCVLDEAEIARIAVREKARRKGVGSRILSWCEEYCIGKEITRLLLDVRESNQAARNFYEKQGFLVDGIRKNFYEMPRENAVLMSKRIQETLSTRTGTHNGI